MGFRLIQQRRGKGSAVYKSPGHKYLGPIEYPSLQDKAVRGEVIDIMDCPGHSSPLAYIQFDDEQACLVPAALGLRVGTFIEAGNGAKPSIGSIVALKDIPSGADVSAIELTPGGGAKVVRVGGSTAKILAKDAGMVTLQMPSKKRMILNERCRAIVGVLAGGGRLDKPFVKAGNKFYAKKSKNKVYPIVSGVAMNAVNHPFGCGRGRHVGKAKSVSRHAPPGRKVGAIASRRTGRTKR